MKENWQQENLEKTKKVLTEHFKRKKEDDMFKEMLREMLLFSTPTQAHYDTDWKRLTILNLMILQKIMEVKKKMFEINCPFCEGNSVSDIIDSIEDVDGQWECSNGHQFVIKYIRKM